MLHAIEKSKTTFYRRYLGYRDSEDIRVCEEDEITSTILGPMDFMPPADIFQFWKELFLIISRGDEFPSTSPNSIELKLWPRRQARIDGKPVEPDASIKFQWHDRSLLFLIEFKWRAPLSRENQLHRQWNEYLTPKERVSAFHLFIAPTITEGVSAKDSELGDIWSGRLILIPWSTFRIALNKCIDKNDKTKTSLSRWSVCADRFLERIGIKQFVGFDHLIDELRFNPPSSSPLFWEPFQGVSVFVPPGGITSLSSPLFFSSITEDSNI